MNLSRKEKIVLTAFTLLAGFYFWGLALQDKQRKPVLEQEVKQIQDTRDANIKQDSPEFTPVNDRRGAPIYSPQDTKAI